MKKTISFIVCVSAAAFFLYTVTSIQAQTAAQDFVVLEDPGNGAFVHGVNDVGQRIFSVSTVTKEFYRTHGDDYDFLAIFTTFPITTPGSYLVKSTVKGIGIETNYGTDQYDVSPQYGSRGKLQTVSAVAFDFLGNPNVPVQNGKQIDLGNLIHELAHRWGIFVGQKWKIVNPRAVGHYNPSGHIGFSATPENADWVNSESDILGGNSLFATTVPNTFFYATASASFNGIERTLSPLTLYLMGLFTPNEVSPLTILRAPVSVEGGFRGATDSVSIADIIQAHGARIPSAADAQKDFSVAVIVVTENGKTLSEDARVRAANLVSVLPLEWAKMTRCRSTMSTNMARTNMVRCTPPASAQSTVSVPPFVDIGSGGYGATSIVVTLRDVSGNPLQGRNVRVVPDPLRSSVTLTELQYHHSQELRMPEPVGYGVTAQDGSVSFPLRARVAGTYAYSVIVDGERLDLHPTIQFRDEAIIDTDGDGLSDRAEREQRTDPNKLDTDGDGYSDGEEVRTGHDPLKVEPVKWKKFENKKFGIIFQSPSVVSEYTDKHGGTLQSFTTGLSNSTGAITVYKKSTFLKERSWIAAPLLRVTKNFKKFKEDRSTKNQGGKAPDSGPSYIQWWKRMVGGVPALDHRFSGSGGVGRSVYVIRGAYVYEIFHDKGYFFNKKGELKTAPYSDFEKFLTSIRFIENKSKK